MAIYDIDGNTLDSCYDIDGTDLPLAYDVDGEIIYSQETTLTVMTYNVQWFTGINGQQQMQQSIINTYAPDLIGLQELTQNGTVPTIGQNVLSGYTLRLSNHKNYIAFASKLPLSNVIVQDFQSQDPYDMSTWGETRAYMLADLTKNGKTIKWLNTHLCVHNLEYKSAQFAEIFNLIKDMEHVIITGDFNLITWDEYDDTFKMFADAGFKLANTTGVKTYTDLTSATSLADFKQPTDNIIVSSDIDIDSVVFDTTKLSNLNGNAIDHVPVIVTLTIK